MSGDAKTVEERPPAIPSFEAIVIGSGFGGAVTAARLSEAGMQICLLERGRRFGNADFPVIPADSFWPKNDDQPDERKTPDFSRALWAFGHGLWEMRDLGEILVGQAAAYGGGSHVYANVHLRAPDEAFDPWPDKLSGETLRPYYDLAAYMLEVETLPQDLPKTLSFEKAADALLPKHLSGRFRPPLAVHFGNPIIPRRVDHQAARDPDQDPEDDPNPRGPCDMRGECLFGCGAGAKNTLDRNYLRKAELHGATVRTEAEVTAIVATQGGYQVRFRDHQIGGVEKQLHARYVFLCAGAVNSTELLLRSRDQYDLPVSGTGLGEHFYPNADDLAVAFECEDDQESDRGPTITSSVYFRGEDNTSLLIQDGGLPTHLGPFLGMFRSPLWLRRNGFGHGRDDKDGGVPLPQRVGLADLPMDFLLDALAELNGGSLVGSLPLSNEVSRKMINIARDRPALLADALADATPGRWALIPDQLRKALSRIRDTLLAELTLTSEPFIEGLILSASDRMPGGLLDNLTDITGRFDLATLPEGELRSGALRLAIQSFWGSQAGLLGAIVNLFDPFAHQDEEFRIEASRLLRWAFDFRAGDGHSAILLTFGRDSRPGRLELVPEHFAKGTMLTASQSGAQAVIVDHQAAGIVVAPTRGDKFESEIILAGESPVGRCTSFRRYPAEPSQNGDVEMGSAAATNGLLGVMQIEASDRDDTKRFRSDSYRNGEWESPRASPDDPFAGRTAFHARSILRAAMPERRTTPERGTQELLLRDFAAELGGELRTNPLPPFFDRQLTVHAQGGCPMSDRPDDGVTSPEGEVRGCDGLFVMDAAAFPYSVGVNPSATIAAVAEWKIEQFIRKHARGDWTADELDWATTNAANKQAVLDPIRHLAPATASPRHEPIGITFSEIMRGTHRPFEGRDVKHLSTDMPVTTALDVSIFDLGQYLADDRAGNTPQMDVSGKITLHWPETNEHGEQVKGGACEYPIEPQGSFMQIASGCDHLGQQTRSLRYYLRFAVSGRENVPSGIHVLDGVKDIRDDARFDVWEDTTTLTFVLALEKEGETETESPYGWGVLRLTADDFFGGQLRSFKATNTDNDAAREAWALASFGRYFFGHLVDVYMASSDRFLDLAKNLGSRGHA